MHECREFTYYSRAVQLSARGSRHISTEHMDLARHHVAGHTLTAKTRECTGVQEPLGAGDCDMDDLAKFVIRDSESYNVTNRRECRYDFFNFRRAQAVTAAFDHCVGASDIPKDSIRVPINVIAAMQDLLIADEMLEMRIRPYLSLSVLRTVPVAQ